jgi:hypothetical protein
VPISEEEIEAVRRILRSGLAVYPCPFLDVGSRIYIEHGPPTSLEGIITNTDRVYRLVVSIALLKRSVAVEIEYDWARPISNSLPSRGKTRFAHQDRSPPWSRPSRARGFDRGAGSGSFSVRRSSCQWHPGKYNVYSCQIEFLSSEETARPVDERFVGVRIALHEFWHWPISWTSWFDPAR